MACFGALGLGGLWDGDPCCSADYESAEDEEARPKAKRGLAKKRHSAHKSTRKPRRATQKPGPAPEVAPEVAPRERERVDISLPQPAGVDWDGLVVMLPLDPEDEHEFLGKLQDFPSEDLLEPSQADGSNVLVFCCEYKDALAASLILAHCCRYGQRADLLSRRNQKGRNAACYVDTSDARLRGVLEKEIEENNLDAVERTPLKKGFSLFRKKKEDPRKRMHKRQPSIRYMKHQMDKQLGA